ncbi:MAG: hypothetical protein SFU56_21240 [Capsulimonadales bacterium]|nr:hypothetical protein [Capsulimonadales bacterium]
MPEASRTSERWRRAEWTLLAVFLLCQFWHLRFQAGSISGFDAGDYLHRVNLTAAGVTNPELRSAFWAYHPPLAFLAARALMGIPGVTDVLAVQWVAKLSLLTAFFAVRAVLARMDLLSVPAGIAFLYLFPSLPLMVHASASLNMDMPVLALGSLVLLASIRLWRSPDRSLLGRVGWGVLLVGSLVAALFVKFSGLLLAALPPLVAVNTDGPTSARLRRLGSAMLPACCAILIAFPYFYGRYYVPTGSFFPNVNEWWYPDELRAARAARDADRTGFVADLFLPARRPPGDPGATRDPERTRLVDTWEDLWRKDAALGPTTPTARGPGRLYALLFAGAILVGGVRSAFRNRAGGGDAWAEWGRIVLPFGLLQLLALIAFIWQQPIVNVIPGKCLYILPIAWSVAYLAASLLPTRPDSPRPFVYLAFLAPACFFVLNLVLPVY